MQDWKSHIDLAHPCWDGYRVALRSLDGDGFPGPEALTRILPPGQAVTGGNPVRFRAASELPDVAYEKHIHDTGEVSTRENNWHDLFNALVWSRFPRFKSAMNELHYRHLHEEENGRRGSQRDALTLLDESGVIVTGSDSRLLDALSGRNWQEAFVECHGGWLGTTVIVCGHAILEKFLQPYKALTAHALILPMNEPLCVADLDGRLADRLLEGGLLDSTKDLSPLPLMGIPGWWQGVQDEAFYADHGVFRPPRPD